MLSAASSLLLASALMLAPGSAHAVAAPQGGAEAEAEDELETEDEREADPAPVIGDVEIVAHEVWDSGDPELFPVFRAANKLHVRTRTEVIRRELLFRSGEPLDREALDQTERNLRALKFLRDARVEVIPRQPEPGAEVVEGADGPLVVDVRVTTWDTWTTAPEVKFSKIGNRYVWNLGLSEKNFLGWGQHIEVSRRSGLETPDTFVFFRDPNLMGSRWRLSGEYSNRPDGDRTAFVMERPYYAIDARWSASARVESSDQFDFLYRDGERVGELRHVRRWQEVAVSRAVVRRPRSAVRFHAAFRQREDEVGGELRDFGIVEIGVSRAEHRFVELQHVNRFEATEDFNLGAEYAAFLGVSTESLGGGPQRAWFLSLSHRRGFSLGPGHFVLGRAAWNGRHRDGQLENALLDAHLSYLNKLTERHLLLAVARYRHGTNLDPEVQLTQGAESGLRGYPVHQFVGDRSLSLSAEHRWFVADDVARLLSFGVSAFVDSGFAWPSGQSVDLGDLRTDVGVGLLVGRNRLSSSQPALRFDLAYALEPVAGHGRWLFSTGSDIEF